MKERIREYFSVLQPGWIRNHAPGYASEVVPPILLSVLLVYPLWCDGVREGAAEWFAAYYAIAAPLLFAMLATPLHPVTLPKLLYLCPLGRAQRARLLRERYLCKLAVPAVLCASVMAVSVAAGVLSVLTALLTFLQTSLQAVCLGSMTWQDMTLWSKKNGRGAHYRNFWHPFSLFCGLMHLFLFCLGCEAALAVAALPLLPVAVLRVRDAARAMEQAQEYEEAYAVGQGEGSGERL